MANSAPVDHLSYSALTLFLANRLMFKKKYIMKIYDEKTSPAAVVGRSGHKALEHYLKTRMPGSTHKATEAEAIDQGVAHLKSVSPSEIDLGKTGSVEKMIKDYTQSINFYFSEMPDYHKIVAVEEGITEVMKDRDGNELAIPGKAYADVIVENEVGEWEVIDHKFVTKYTDNATDKAQYIVQAMFNFHTIEAKYGVQPARMVFRECKISKNKDGSDQTQEYAIEFDDLANFAFFYNIFNDVVRELIKPDVQYLPNFSDMFDGQNAFEVYRQGLGSDAPVPTQRKTKELTFTDKKYIPSATAAVENKDLTTEEKIRMKLMEFGVPVEMQETHVGATITQYTLKPSRGVKMNTIAKLDKDLAIALKAHSIRIDAPIRGTDLVGIEVPSTKREIIAWNDKFLKPGTMEIPVGVDVYGKMYYRDLTEMPHLLIAGATGAGKSVMLNVILKSLSEQMSPSQMQLILIDPKRVELSQFSRLPHLLSPVIFDDDQAGITLDWLVREMEERYEKLAEAGVRSINEYNGMTKIVCVIDEFADLMLSGGQEGKKAEKKKVFGMEVEVSAKRSSAEQAIVRLAQKARAVGIHLILATQRPSADVVTGLLKANIPTKIAFMTTSKVNSQIILDQNGAEELTGKGDMLFLDPTKQGVVRLQGIYL